MKPRRLHRETITSMVIVIAGGPDMAPRPPPLGAPRPSRGAPRLRPVRHGGPDMAPTPPPLVAPRPSRGAPRLRASAPDMAPRSQDVSSPLSGRLGQPPHLAQELRGARRLADQSCHVCFQRRPQLGLDAAEGLGQRLLPA